MAQLFLRSGLPASGRILTDDKGKPYTLVERKCSRCGGAGGSDRWAHTGWTCFECGGNGASKHGPQRVPLYTADRLAKLNATKAKVDSRRAAKHAAEEAERQAAADVRREAFQAAHADVLPWLRGAVAAVEERRGHRPGDAGGFLPDMLHRADRSCEWSEAQAAAVRKAMATNEARDAKRAASAHIGQIGQRIAMTATVERVREFERPVFSAAWLEETVYITTMRDEAGNALVSKSPSFSPKEGATLAIKGTVKEHGEFSGEKQTTLARVVDVEREKARKAEAKARKVANTPIETAA